MEQTPDGILASLGALRPLWVGRNQSSRWSAWGLNHSVAPWQFDFTQEQWDLLIQRSGYMAAVQRNLLGEPEAMPLHNVIRFPGLCQYTLQIPVFSKAPICDVVSRQSSDSVAHMGQWTKPMNAPFRAHNRGARSLVGVHLQHLLIALVIICTPDGGSTPFDGYVGTEVKSFLHVAGFLASRYLVIHMAVNVVTERSLSVFVGTFRRLWSSGVAETELLMRCISRRNVFLHHGGFELRSLASYQIRGGLLHDTIRGRDHRRRRYEQFWSHQNQFSCLRCLRDLTRMELLYLGRGVDIMECCFSLICGQCLGGHLMSSLACPHFPPHSEVRDCIRESNPWLIRSLLVIYCPVCLAGFSRGMFAWRYTRRCDQPGIRETRRERLYNRYQLIDHPSHYLSRQVRRLAQTNYPGFATVRDPVLE